MSASHLTCESHFLSTKLYLLVFYLFTLLSYLYLHRSSIPSQIIDNVITKAKGAIDAIGFNGDIIGIDYSMAFIKKYILA